MDARGKKSTAEALRALTVTVTVVTLVCAGALFFLGRETAAVSAIVLAVPLLAVLLYVSARIQSSQATRDQSQRQRRTGLALVVFGVVLTVGSGVLYFFNADFLARWLVSAGPGFAVGGAIAFWLARGNSDET